LFFAAEAGTGTASSPYEIGRNLPSVLLNQTSNEAPVISPKLNVTSSKVVRVIVQLSNQPVAVGQYAAEAGVRSFATESTERAIDSQQAAIVNAAKEQGILLKVNYRYNTVLNGMEVSIPANQIPKLAELPGVKSIYENSVYYTIPVQDPPKGTNPDGSIVVSGKSTKEFALAVQPDATAVTGDYEGEVVLTANGYPTLHLPFVLHVGTSLPDAGLGIQEVTLSDRNVRLNGKQDSIDVGFHLTATDSNVMELNVYDMNDVAQGTLAQVVQPVTDEGYPLYKPGYYNFNNIDNVVMVADNNGTSLKVLPPGQYKLELAVYHVSPQGVTDPESVHPAYSSYRITGTEKDRIHTAEQPFRYILDGQQVIGKSVIALNDTDRSTYKVLSSSDAKYVDNNGTLLKYPTSGSRIVKLNIQIQSVADPTVKTTVKALIKIKAPAK